MYSQKTLENLDRLSISLAQLYENIVKLESVIDEYEKRIKNAHKAFRAL